MESGRGRIMLALSQRRRLPEIMDRPDLRPARHLGALRGLARVNFWSGSAGILFRPLADLARRLGRPIRVLDVASGGGDVPLRLWSKARRAGLDFRIDGCDLSPLAVEHARGRAAAAGADVHFFVRDVLRGPPVSGYDAVTCSLFLAPPRRGTGGEISAMGGGDGGPRRSGQRPGARCAGMGVGPSRRAIFDHVGRSTRGRPAVGGERVHAERGPGPGRAGGPARRDGEVALAVPILAEVGTPMTLAATVTLEEAARRTWDAVVVGAGPAGATAARELARRSVAVLLVDRAAFPRWKVCGCCLNGRAAAVLRTAGLGALTAGCRAVPLECVQLAAGGRQARVPLDRRRRPVARSLRRRLGACGGRGRRRFPSR